MGKNRLKKNHVLKKISITDLHESLIMNILTFLPIQFLIRCRCVCKNWATQIAHPNFIESYDSSGRAPVQFLIEDSSDLTKPNNLFLVQLDQASCTTNSPPGPLIPRKIRFSSNFLHEFYPDPSSYSLRVLNTCRVTGFIAACAFKDSKIHISATCHVFNPVTGQHILVKKPETNQGCKCHYRWQYSCALVFARKTNQLKLVILSWPEFVNKSVMVKIQTIGTNSWRDIGRIPFSPSKRAYPAFANGLYYWIDPRNRILYSFNADEEVFDEVQTPPCIKDFSESYVGVLNDSLCIIMESPLIRIMEFWVLSEDVNGKSWTNKLIIDNDKICFYQILEPLKCLENGEIAMLCRRFKAVCYNPRTGRYKRIKFAGKDCRKFSCIRFPYVSSLRSVQI